eukprot:2922873-Rhodomonas_salina.3
MCIRDRGKRDLGTHGGEGRAAHRTLRRLGGLHRRERLEVLGGARSERHWRARSIIERGA